MQVRVERATGDAAHEVPRVAAREGDTLVVMGIHGRGRVAEAVLGSVSRAVVRTATGPVLLVPGGE
jgi:nucleotide-binding universal stress UspA family protein